MGIKSSTSVNRGRGLSAPKIGGNSGGGNLLQAMILMQARGQEKLESGQRERGNIAQDIETVKQQSPGGKILPGTTLNVGGVNTPLNRELTEAEMNAVTGADKFEQLASDITKQIDNGVLGDTPMGRPYNQFLGEGGGNPIARQLTPDDSEIEKLASNLVELQKYAFSEGGKNLTPTELQVVKAGLSIFGKGNNAIKHDLMSAIDILRRKKEIVLGGVNAVSDQPKSPIPGSPGYQSAQGSANPVPQEDPIEAIKKRFKQRNP